MAKIIHSMIRVVDEQRSVNFYRDAFQLEVNHRWDFDTFTLVYLKNPLNDFELELTINKGRTEPYEMGTAYGHLAVVVDDLDSEHARFVDAGFEPREIVEFSHEDELLARFFFVTDPDGYEIEVLQRHGRFR